MVARRNVTDPVGSGLLNLDVSGLRQARDPIERRIGTDQPAQPLPSQVVCMMPPLFLTTAHVDRALTVLEETVTEAEEG